MFHKLEKLMRLFGRASLARGLLAFGIPGAVEHSSVIAFVRPRHLIDVGANKGQFALATLAINPTIVIDCFEPVPASATKLEKWAKATSSQIRVHRVALAKEKGTAQFHVTTREDSSSLFPPASPQLEIGVSVKETIVVETDRLDHKIEMHEVLRPSLLKIDVQGGELNVLRGIGDLCNVIDYIYLEVSFVELYESQPLFSDIDAFLTSCGYKLLGMSNAYVDKKIGPTQADALYGRVEPFMRD
ncbi:FkbM family methyltransferase [Methylosinus sporium]|uniref:FkbM family methyltransferase n=1 Tax=Methylosinus sporium TaxID=428 RepID=UPI003839E694